MQEDLPVLTCDDCGVCCRGIGSPPFVGSEILELPENLQEEILVKGTGSIWDKNPNELTGSPCYWYDTDTGRCKNYDNRPQICRDFEIGSWPCLSYRQHYGVK